MLLVMGINLYSSRIILQALGIQDYGIYNTVGSIVVMFSIINGTLSTGTSRFLAYELGCDNIEKLKKTFSASFMMHVLIALIVFVLAETIGLWFLNEKLVIPESRIETANWLFQFSIVSCMLNLTQVPYTAIIIAHERMKVYAWVGLAEAAFKLMSIYIILYAPFSNKLYVYGVTIMIWSILLQLFFRIYCVRKFVESSLSIVRDRSIYKGMLSFSLWDSIGAFCTQGNSQGINILTNLFFGVSVNAARGVAFQVENGITQFSRGFMMAVNPQITKLYAQKKEKEFFTLVYESAKFSYFLLFLIALPIFVETEYILSIWLVKVPEYTVVFIRYIIIIQLIRTLNNSILQAVHSTGNIKFLNLTSGLVSLFLEIPLTYLLYKLGYPPQSTFWVIIGVYIIANYLECKSLKRNIDYSIVTFVKNVYLRSIAVSLLGSIPVIIIVTILDTSLYRLGAVVLLDIVSLSICVLFFGVSKNTRKYIIKYISGKINI